MRGLEDPVALWHPLPGRRDVVAVRLRHAGRREADAVVTPAVRALGGAHGRLGHRPDGQPFVQGWDGQISLSHSESGIVAVAARGCAAVGVDIEPASAETRLAALLAAFRRRGARLSGNASAVREWTAREAVAKAGGGGLFAVLTGVTLDFSTHPASARDGAGRTWELYAIDPDPVTTATLAIAACRRAHSETGEAA